MMIKKILPEQYSEFAKHETIDGGREREEEREHSHNNLWDPHSHPQMAEFLPEASYTGCFFPAPTLEEQHPEDKQCEETLS